MISFLVNRFIPNSDDVNDPKVRTAYGVLSGLIGIICNLFLFTVKVSVGLLIRSMSVVADAFNNLSDAASSIISLAAARAADKPADREHPFGHGRVEYIAAFVVAFLVLDVGLRLFQSSISAILHPKDLAFTWVALVLLALSVVIKLWLFLFNRHTGKLTGSKVMKATSADSFFDALVTSVTILSLILFKTTGINIDGYAGLMVSCIVLWAGLGIARDALSVLIGAETSEDIYRQVALSVRKDPRILDAHDLIIHDYGPGRSMATIHIQLPKRLTFEESHSISNETEKRVLTETGIMLVVHADPTETEDARVLSLQESLQHVLQILDPALSFHDFQVDFSGRNTFLSWDLDMPYTYTKEKEDLVINQISSFMKELHPGVVCEITADRGAMSSIRTEH